MPFSIFGRERPGMCDELLCWPSEGEAEAGGGRTWREEQGILGCISRGACRALQRAVRPSCPSSPRGFWSSMSGATHFSGKGKADGHSSRRWRQSQPPVAWAQARRRRSRPKQTRHATGGKSQCFSAARFPAARSLESCAFHLDPVPCWANLGNRRPPDRTRSLHSTCTEMNTRSSPIWASNVDRDRDAPRGAGGREDGWAGRRVASAAWDVGVARLFGRVHHRAS